MSASGVMPGRQLLVVGWGDVRLGLEALRVAHVGRGTGEVRSGEDLAAALGLPAAAEDDPALELVLEVGARRVSWRARGSAALVSVARADIVPLPGVFTEREPAVVAVVFAAPGRPILVLDPEALCARRARAEGAGARP